MPDAALTGQCRICRRTYRLRADGTIRAHNRGWNRCAGAWLRPRASRKRSLSETSMTATPRRQPPPPRSDPDAARTAAKIALGFREIALRRELINREELRAIEVARAWGWAWADIAAAYGPSPRTGASWSIEGARKRYLSLSAACTESDIRRAGEWVAQHQIAAEEPTS